MKRISVSTAIVLAFFSLFMVYPLADVLLRACMLNGSFSAHFFITALRSSLFRETIANSSNLAIMVTLISALIAYPVAFALSRWELPCRRILHTLFLLPLVIPPFVGVLGVRQILGTFGTLNLLLMEYDLLHTPIDWLGSGNLVGLVAVQVVHLMPILYLSCSASLSNVHTALEEAAAVTGASRWRIIRRIIVPLSLPGLFAGAILVFVGSFTDLGTPLIFEYRHVLPVQIFDMLSDVHENPMGYSFVVFTCAICVALFYLAQGSIQNGAYSGGARLAPVNLRKQPSTAVRILSSILLWGYILIASIPHIGVALIAFGESWFMTALPESWTLEHFRTVLVHPLTQRSLINSLLLSTTACVLATIVGYICAYALVRTSSKGKRILEVLTILPLAVPGIVFAFGYVGAFSGTILDNRINPFPLLIAAYIVRRTPNVVRSATAGLQEVSETFEDAARMSGASPSIVSRRIVFPLLRRHLAVGAILTFAYSMLEVSDGLLLAMEDKFYPISKAMYVLMARPDGLELASALGIILMVIMVGAFWWADRLLAGRPQTKRLSGILLFLFFASAVSPAHAAIREVIIVSPHWEGVKREFARGFADYMREETGDEVQIRWLDVGGTSDIQRYITTQFKAHPANVGIDIMFGGGADSFLELESLGALQSIEISEAVLSQIPQEISGVPLYSPAHTWFSAALSTFGILYNKVAVSKLNLPIPATWEDLTKPSFFGLVGAGDPRKSGSMHAMYEIVLQGYGWQEGWRILRSMAANVKNFSGGGTNVGKEIASAEIIYGLAIDTYAGELIRRIGRDRLGYVVPRSYAAVNGDAIGVIRGSPNLDLAQRFIEFVLSERGQRIWYSRKGAPGGPVEFELGKLTILPSLYGKIETASVVQDNPFLWKSGLAYDAKLAGARWGLVNDLFGAFIIDVHDRLRSRGGPAQNALVTASGRTELDLPLSEDTIEQLIQSDQWKHDPAFRSQILQDWSELARKTLPEPNSIIETLRWVPTALFVTILIISLLRTRIRRLQ